jgi:glycosyltransferase involved in cell wall biosynthesis
VEIDNQSDRDRQGLADILPPATATANVLLGWDERPVFCLSPATMRTASRQSRPTSQARTPDRVETLHSEPATGDASAHTTCVHSRAWVGATPTLSVLIPCYRDEPLRLLSALDRRRLPVEIVLLDDGTGDEALAARLADAVREMAAPALFIRLHANEGRAKGRNRLAAASRAAFLLFLDADMLPDTDDFLERWLDLIGSAAPAVAFGGYSLDQAPKLPGNAVHRALALRSDCLPAEVRRLAPEKHVFTSNLLVRRDVFEQEPFDRGFAGWGWEDVEWGMRVSRRHTIHHVEIHATHLGLDPADVLAAKYEQSAANFARLAATHPDIVAAYRSYRVARMLKRAPMLRVWRPWLKAAGLTEALPVALRAFALRLYRAALCAEVI